MPRAYAYTEEMLARLSVRLAPITNRAAEYGPGVPACCNVCRTCTTTNAVGLVLGGGAAVAYAVARLARRVVPRQGLVARWQSQSGPQGQSGPQSHALRRPGAYLHFVDPP